MIAVFLSTEHLHRAAIRMAGRVDETVDGPFHAAHGLLGGEPALFLCGHGTPDSAYAGCRIAARRGAQRIIGLVEARSPGAGEGIEVALPAHSLDLGCLGEWCRLHPANEEPPPIAIDLAAAAGRTPVNADASRAASGALAMMPADFAHPALAAMLAQRQVADLFDPCSCGLVDGARDSEVPLVLLAVVMGAVLPPWESPPRGLAADKGLERALSPLFTSGR